MRFKRKYLNKMSKIGNIWIDGLKILGIQAEIFGNSGFLEEKGRVLNFIIIFFKFKGV